MIEAQGPDQPFPDWERFPQADVPALVGLIKAANKQLPIEVLRIAFAEDEGSFRRAPVGGFVPSFESVAGKTIGAGIVTEVAKLIDAELSEEEVERLSGGADFSVLPSRVLKYVEEHQEPTA